MRDAACAVCGGPGGCCAAGGAWAASAPCKIVRAHASAAEPSVKGRFIGVISLAVSEQLAARRSGSGWNDAPVLHREEDGTLGGQRLVDPRDEVARRPWSVRAAPALVVTLTRLERQHLLQRLPLILVVLNEVADDRDHVLVEHHVRLIAQPTMPGDDHRTALRLI